MKKDFLLRQTTLMLLSALCLFGLMSNARAQSISLVTDRTRITVATIPDAMGGAVPLKVLRTDNGTPLRAGTAWLWEDTPQEQPAEYYAAMRGRGMNAVRLILFDTWQNEDGVNQGKTNWNDPVYRARALGRIERAINFCSINGMYAIINSHNKIPNFDVAYNQALWTQVAPHFKNRTNVIYEMDNEALSGTGIGASGTYEADITRLQDLRNTYDNIRAGAPSTHVMVLTPSGISGWGFVDGMARMTRRFEGLGSPIDWTKTSVAYHLYHGDVNFFPAAENLRNFHSQYPGWPSENNFPSSLSSAQLEITDDWRSIQFGSDEFINQTCERLGLGWSHWNINGGAQLAANWPFLWGDAVAKGYTWQPDPVYNDLVKIAAGSTGVGAFSYDINYYGGDTVTNNPTGVVDVSGVASAAPSDVYRSERYGNFTYGFARLIPGQSYIVRSHFAESYDGITAPGQRVFNVYANNGAILTNVDIYAAAGQVKNRAVVRDATVVADAGGRILLRFESVTQSAKVNGIELLPSSAVAVSAPSFTPPAGIYRSSVSVAIATTTPGASIRYTNNGATPTMTSGTLYTSPVVLNRSRTLKAIAYKDGVSSPVTTGVFTITK